MDYIDISNGNHDQRIKDIIDIINNNPENKKMNFFIETIMQSNKDEYQLLCRALYKFITTQGGDTAATAPQPESPTAKRLIEKLNQIKSPIKIPRKNKLLIDEQFRLIEDKYKYYLSFYIIDAINNITVSSSGS